jgi:hypothetical protein
MQYLSTLYHTRFLICKKRWEAVSSAASEGYFDEKKYQTVLRTFRSQYKLSKYSELSWKAQLRLNCQLIKKGK